jgi:SAM-dependent methyltransferase
MNTEAVKEFFDTSSIYDQVLDLNYMFHDEIYREVARLLSERFAGRSFSMLDLGCGSARHLAKALEGCSVEHYVGYDLSDIALEEARYNLSGLGCPLELKQADLLEGLKAETQKFDLIFSSFAVHHLSSADKKLFFQLACQRLGNDGILLLIDVVRDENKNRAEFLDDYCGWIQADWKGVSHAGLNLIFDHIRQNDFPEPNSILQDFATKGGFVHSVKINQFRWHAVWQCDKAQPA